MFFNTLKKLTDKAISDITTLSAGPHTTSKDAEAMEDRQDQASLQLKTVRDKAEKLSGKALLVWVLVGLPNIFISIPLISLPLFAVTVAAVAVTGCQYLKAQAAKNNLHRLHDEASPLIKQTWNDYHAYADEQLRQTQLAAQEANRAARKNKVADIAPASEGFNVSASDLDLDKDMTVRRIKLKPQAPAAA